MLDLIPDPRLNAYRGDLAAIELQGKVNAARFVAGTDYQITSLANICKSAALDSVTTQALHGEIMRIYDMQNNIAWGQLSNDNYVGYIDVRHLIEPLEKPTHKVAQLLTHLYPAPDLKSVPVGALTLNAAVTVTATQDRFVKSGDHWLVSSHLQTTDAIEKDFIKTAQRFIDTPYLWGGRSALGIDCSGLVQLSLQCAGINAPRDSDMQRDQLGTLVDFYEPLQRGDLVFFAGHVGIMVNDKDLLHANATHMKTTIEPLKIVAERSADKDGQGIIGIRRL